MNMNKRLERIINCPEMEQAVNELDKCDFSVILSKFLKDVNFVDDLKDILSKYVDDERIQLAMDWFTEYDWVVYFETRYNLKFTERSYYVCFNPENGVIKKYN